MTLLMYLFNSLRLDDGYEAKIIQIQRWYRKCIKLNIECMQKINKRIKKEVCYETLANLSDINLLDDYKHCNSVKKNTSILMNILEKFTKEDVSKKILDEYMLNLIPPGTKGVIRGNRFNKIVKEYIERLILNKERFEICFEKKYVI